MSSLVETELTYFFSSSESLGATNKDLNGSRFQVRLNKPIAVPPAAVDVSIECVAANIWYNSPNVAAEFGNNTFHFEYASVPFSFVLPDGLYGSDTLNQIIQRNLAQTDNPLGGKFSPTSIVISENVATQRVVISLADGMTIRTDPAFSNNIAATLGFTHDIHTNLISTFTGHSFEGDEVAQLNRINSYLLHTDLVHDGISINNSYDSILSEMQLTVPPGSLLTYRPYLPYKVSGKHLKFGTKDNLTFYLTDEQNRPIDTFGENYSFTLVIRYKVKEHATMMQINNPHL